MKEKKSDLLIGSRFLDGRSRIPWMKREILLPLACFFQRVFLGIHLSDAHNGFRILNRHALDAIHITQGGMAHATEIPLAARRAGLTVVEYPVKVVYREYGQGARGGLTIVKDLFLGKFVK